MASTNSSSAAATGLSDFGTTFQSPDNVLVHVKKVGPSLPDGAVSLRRDAVSAVRDAVSVSISAVSMTPDDVSVSPSPYELEMMVLFCLCHVCIGFSMGAVAPAMEPITNTFALTDSWRGIFGSAALAGNILGNPTCVSMPSLDVSMPSPCGLLVMMQVPQWAD